MRKSIVRNLGSKMHGRRLAPARYLPNIGKAMYGYNHFLGAPSSSSNAGTDPGFVHRPVWKSSYTQGNVVTMKTFDSVPKATYQASKAPPTGEPMWLNLHGKTVSASSGNPKAAVDRNTDANYAHGSCTHSRNEVNPWWKVDLGDKYNILAVRVSNRDECWTRLDNFEIHVDNLRCSHGNKVPKGGTKDFQCQAVGSSVKISLRKREVLTLCEVGVKASLPAPQAPQRRMSALSEVSAFLFGAERKSQQEKVPDGWTVTKAVQTVCDKHFTTKEIKSQYDFQREESFSLNPLGISISIGDFSFSLAYETRNFAKSNSKSRKVLYKSSAECLEYIAEMNLASPPPVSDNFKYVADSVGSEQQFYTLFDMFGLHFPTKLLFGAKYGFTRYMDESSWSQLTSSSEKLDVGVQISKGIETGMEDQGVEMEASVSLNYGNHHQQSEQQKFDSHFTEIKEFSLGRVMPRQGGAAEWAKQVDMEPMPIRYGLTSICEHPSLVAKKEECIKSTTTYCTKHLQKARGDISCDPPEQKQCLWDLDCLPNNVCSEGACMREPGCSMVFYSKADYGGSQTTYGPYFFSETPMGRFVDTPNDKHVDSVKISDGCAEVILMDADSGGCKENRDDNLVLNNRASNGWRGIPNLPEDLQNDICGFKAYIKKRWS